MDLKLSTSEKKAVARILLDIALADGVLTEEETDLMVNIAGALGISVEEVKASRNMSVTKCLGILRDMNEADKPDIGKFMVAMMAIDGHIDDDEIKIIAGACLAACIGRVVPDDYAH